MEKDIIEKLENHEKRISKNEDDIGNMKIDNATQQVTIKNLNESIKKLTETIEKTIDKFDIYVVNNCKKSSENYKWIIGVILIPIIFYLFKYVIR